MTQLSGEIGLVVILIWYAGIGLLATAGSVALTQRFFPGKSEQLFYGTVFVLIAGVYLAFTAHFANAATWRTEFVAAVAFSVLGIAGTRYAAALIVGYPLHGLWDSVHELVGQTNFAYSVSGELTAVPLAYGVFCAVFDIAIAIYFVRRKQFWN